MAIRLSELPLLIETRVTVEVQGDDDVSSWTIEGLLIAVGDAGVVVKNSDGPQIVMRHHILDIKKTVMSRKIVRRKIRHIVMQQVRQHLLDRHGMPWDLVKMMRPDSAFQAHESIDHSNLGHQHAAPGEGGEE